MRIGTRHPGQRGATINTPYGTVAFDARGLADVPEDAALYLLGIDDYFRPDAEPEEVQPAVPAPVPVAPAGPAISTAEQVKAWLATRTDVPLLQAMAELAVETANALGASLAVTPVEPVDALAEADPADAPTETAPVKAGEVCKYIETLDDATAIATILGADKRPSVQAAGKARLEALAGATGAAGAPPA